MKDSTSPGDYLVVGDPDHPTTWHLQVRKGGKADHGLMGAAKAALTSPGGHRGNRYDGPDKAEALAKLKALYTREGLAFAEPHDPDHDGDDDRTPDGDTDRDAAGAADQDADDPDDPDGDEAGDATGEQPPAAPKGASDQPDAADVHVDGYLGAPAPAKAPQHYIKRLLGSLRERMAQRGMVQKDEFDGMVTSARSHAGGKGRAAKRAVPAAASAPAAFATEGGADGEAGADRGSFAVPCAACAAGNASDCACPGCVLDDADCWCCAADAGAVADAQAGGPPLEDAPLRYADPLRTSTGQPVRLFVEAPVLGHYCRKDR